MSHRPFPLPVVAASPLAEVAASRPAGLNFRQSPPLALYIHIPWCVRKCPYCDFNSHEAKDSVPEAAYLAALISDLEHALPSIWGRPIVSIFFGGGTPSLLSPEGLAELLTQIRMRVKLLPGAEITLEANPGTVDAARFHGFRAAGVNRLSLGIQSFNATHLQALGRIHDPEQAKAAVALAASIFPRFNLDLMYGLPQQTLDEALADIETALSFSPKHLSCYQLTLEPNTPFAAFPPELPESDLCADMQEAIEARLAAAGFDNYETSAFAIPGEYCQHNLNYWQFGDYLGIGAGAHSKITRHDGVTRQMRHKHPSHYLAAANTGAAGGIEVGAALGQANPFLQENRELSAEDLPFEFMMNALRLRQGFRRELYETHTSLPLTHLAAELAQAEKLGLLNRDASNSHYAPSLRGRRFLNQLLNVFLAE